MNTGGQAFPVADTYHPNGQVQFGSYGMTLLDWFAGQALAGILADSESQGEPEEFAAAAYNIAESMLAEKARREAVVKESSTTDHSPDANKMVELEARNRELVERIKRLEEALSLFIVDCDNLHHSKKHQHGFHDPCPVVDLILDAKEAKP